MNKAWDFYWGACPKHARQLFAVYVKDKDDNFVMQVENRTDYIKNMSADSVARKIGGRLVMECIYCQTEKWKEEHGPRIGNNS